MIYHIVYMSKSTTLLSNEMLTSLLTQARSRNFSKSVTGMLLYKDQSFIQILEGGKSAVLEIFESIKQDSRHFHVRVLDEATKEARTFVEWSMGFVNLSNDYRNIEGFNDYFSSDVDFETFVNQPHEVIKFLQFFRSMS